MDAFRDLAAEILDLPAESITDGLTPQQAPSWDSLTHLRLISAVEAQFGLQFAMAEIQAVASIGDLRRLIEQGTGAKVR